MDSAEFQQKLLAGTEALTAKVKLLETALAASGSEGIAAKAAITEIEKAMADIRKSQLALKAQAGSVKRNGEISRDAALFLGGIGCLAALKAADGLGYTSAQREFLANKAADIFGIEAKAALTTSDIPMPTQFMGDVVELVYEYGVARQLATVFPMGNVSIKLPKLGTDTTFGLIAASGSVPEKSPTISFVTMTAEKFGGMVRLPSEIDDDSVVAVGQFLARYGARQLAYVEDYQVFRSTGAGSGLNGTGKGLTKLCVDNSIVINQASTKTKQSDATLQNFRDLRNASNLNGAVLGRACYYVHPTYEALFASFNTSATVTPYVRNGVGGAATLDGFPIKWVNVMPAYSTSVSVSLAHALFGDASYQYLGVRGGPSFVTSREAGFATDEVLVRALERLTVGYMANDAVAALVTAAS